MTVPSEDEFFDITDVDPDPVASEHYHADDVEDGQ